MSKVRLRFSKLGKVRWTSHRDVARMWERALRRAEVPPLTLDGGSRLGWTTWLGRRRAATDADDLCVDAERFVERP